MVNKSLYKIWASILMIAPVLVYFGLMIYAYFDPVDVAGPGVGMPQILLLGLLYVGPFIIIGFIIGKLYLNFSNERLATSSFSDWSVKLGIFTLVGSLFVGIIGAILFGDYGLNFNSEGASGLVIIPAIVLWATGIGSMIFFVIGIFKAYKLNRQG